jgi:hypothetical protein
MLWFACTLFVGFSKESYIGTVSESYIEYQTPRVDGGVIPKEQQNAILEHAEYLHSYEFQKIFLESELPVLVSLERQLYVVKIPGNTNYVAAMFADLKFNSDSPLDFWGDSMPASLRLLRPGLVVIPSKVNPWTFWYSATIVGFISAFGITLLGVISFLLGWFLVVNSWRFVGESSPPDAQKQS